MTRMTGDQARGLLDGTTPGPWEARPNGVVVSYNTGAQIQLVGHNQRALGDAPLMAAAPDLAATVAWLYGREPDSVDSEGNAEWSFELFKEVATFGGMVYDLDGREHSPDEAVEYARALLAAAETARNK